jgi:hypothetical protein
MDEADTRNMAPQCNSAPRLDCETAEILLRYASFAAAGLPSRDVDHVIAILARQRDDSARDSRG